MPATDPFANASGGVTGPIVHVVVPTLDQDMAVVARALWVGVSGSVVLVTQGGEQVTLAGVAAGMWHPIRFSRVVSGGSATGVLAGY